ncbi:hypothetical protein F5B17DRAFT_349972 [Nemania serpens]|nr:hypothetical protein F5B17DRAFT_349972 [Nemania serpens]
MSTTLVFSLTNFIAEGTGFHYRIPSSNLVLLLLLLFLIPFLFHEIYRPDRPTQSYPRLRSRHIAVIRLQIPRYPQRGKRTIFKPAAPSTSTSTSTSTSAQRPPRSPSLCIRAPHAGVQREVPQQQQHMCKVSKAEQARRSRKLPIGRKTKRLRTEHTKPPCHAMLCYAMSSYARSLPSYPIYDTVERFAISAVRGIFPFPSFFTLPGFSPPLFGPHVDTFPRYVPRLPRPSPVGPGFAAHDMGPDSGSGSWLVPRCDRHLVSQSVRRISR